MRTVINQPVKISEAPGPYDSSFYAVRPQYATRTRVDGPPRLPPAVVTRKHTPVRPVYNDFATAHSSITSRSADGQSRDMSHKNPQKQRHLLDRGRPLPRRTLKSPRRQKKSPHKDEDLTIPVRVKASHHRPISEFDSEISEVAFIANRQPEPRPSLDHPPKLGSHKRASASPFFDGIRKAMSGISSPAGQIAQNRLSRSSNWPRDSMELPAMARKVGQPTLKEVEDNEREIKTSIQLIGRRQPDQQLYLEDPFVYDSNQYPASLGRGGTNAIQTSNVYLAHKDDPVNGDFHDTHDVDAGLDDNDALVHEHVDTPTYFHGGMALAIDSQRTPSTREGSTVDNIVKQYAKNNRLWDISLDSNDEDSEEENGYYQHFKTQDGAKKSILMDGVPAVEDENEESYQSGSDAENEKSIRAFKLTGSSRRAPNAGLPQVPTSLPDHQNLKSVPEGLQYTSSYGDPRDPLDFKKRSHTVPSASSINFHPTTAQQPDQTLPSSTNPFRRSLILDLFAPSLANADSSPKSHLSQKIALDVSESTEYLAGSPLHALERDISRALRRMSAVSNLSQETSVQDHGDGGIQTYTDSCTPVSFIGRHRQQAPEVPNLVPRGFYHESAIRQTWLDSQRIERVRIPVGNNASVISLPESQLASPDTDGFDLRELNGQEQNGNDWETIVDGVTGKVNRTGSSLANNSSAGNISPIFFEHNDFSSTDRIVQHPAQIHYSHDYRYRELKEGSFPVLLPSYKPHTINGFPMNSYPSIGHFQQSSGDFYQSPPPLSRSHTNPFKSPPPEVITKQYSSETTDDDDYLVDRPPRFDFGTNSSQVANGGDSGNWTDEYGDCGPGLKPTQPTRALGTTHLSSNSLSKSYSGSQPVGSSIAGASSSTLSVIIHDLENSNGTKQWGVSCVSPVAAYHGDGAPPAARERVPFIKGPPGAFYQGVRSQPDPRRTGLSLDHKAAARRPRKISRKYPTNQMRHLSLLQVQCTEPVTGAGGSSLGKGPHGDFLYRSPLAPIKSRSWCNLYTREQLSSMHNVVKEDGINDLEGIPRRSSRPACGEDVKTDGSWKRLPWSPHMRPWPRDDSSIKTDLAGRKIKLSSLIFGLCCLFPPMLVLYGVGYLDNMMLWITVGEISAFSKAHKRVALQVVCFFGIAILITVPIVVGIKACSARQPQRTF